MGKKVKQLEYIEDVDLDLERQLEIGRIEPSV